MAASNGEWLLVIAIANVALPLAKPLNMESQMATTKVV
jgi:hypothetical protein